MARAGDEKTCCSCLCGLLVTAGVAVLIYWATFQPHRIRATVDSAELSDLTVVERNNGTDGGVVSYCLAVNVTLRNPSGRVGIYYDAVDARLQLLRDGGASLGPANATSPTVFHQPRMSSTVVAVEYKLGSVVIRARPRVRCSLMIPVKAEHRRRGAGGVLSPGGPCAVKY
ncbi:hypothetical protein E2562_022522 [Oryza meyeriana var. granulata]|uniref:Uncharacterized protein n=1 Tax=Oryza meyeriana var. granulata TaxID=110450 RepID=A0A6G1BN14_9ORYZ|nr:hypothetical protein E2562_022522 [Oryza meyeriana var. granulata]